MTSQPFREAKDDKASHTDALFASFTAVKKVVCQGQGTNPIARRGTADFARDEMAPLPDDALVVRGGLNRAADFAQGSGVTLDATGKLDNVSVNAAAGLLPVELTKPISQSGYPGVPHRQVGVTTVGMIRAVGGDVVAKPTRRNPYHAILKGLTPDQAARLFQPTVPNPNRSP